MFRTLVARAPAKQPRVVVLGSGWGGFQLALKLNKDVPLTVVSPSNHFVFTPLLPSTAVGTLEFRCIQEPVRTILGDQGTYLQAKARSIDLEKKVLTCESIHKEQPFEVEYDKLVIAVGVKTNTFNIDSIKEGKCVFFLKHIHHARQIRNNIIDNFEKAALPNMSDLERKRLLSFVVVGGGPTSCEFVAELHDFVKKDVSRLYKDLLPHVKVTLVEAGPALLGPFDMALQQYVQKLFKKRDIDVRLGTAVTGIEDLHPEGYKYAVRQAKLSCGDTLPFGTMVWSAGLAPVKFTDDLPLNKKSGRIIVDDALRVVGHEGSIWAMGDCATTNDPDKAPLPQLAQVARQQGIHLAKVLNGKLDESEPFKFFSLGSMASLGDYKGVYDGSHVGEPGKESMLNKILPTDKMTGLLAFFLWRMAYWGRQTSLVNKILIPMHWFKSAIFGRDISRF